MSHATIDPFEYHRTLDKVLPQEDWVRFQELQVEVGNNLHDIEERLDSEDLPEEDRSVLELLRNDILFSLWKDENGLLTGALQYARQELFRTGDIEAVNAICRLKAAVNPSLWRGLQYREVEIGLLRTGGSDPYVRYFDASGNLIFITPQEACVRSTPEAAPYLLYRPYLRPDGSSEYRLVREVKVHKYDVDGVPAFLNYLIVKAAKRVYRYMDTHGISEDEAFDYFMDVVLGERRLPDFNEVPTNVEHTEWLEAFNLLLDELESHDVPLKEATALIIEKAKELHVMALEEAVSGEETYTPIPWAEEKGDV